MAGYAALKMKRKDIDDFNDDFSDFSLSSPARKIRRLDIELPPILEEEELEIHSVFDQPMITKTVTQERGGPVIEDLELPNIPKNEERAIVPFRPMNTPLLQSPSVFSVSVSPNLITGFKNQILWSNTLERKDEDTWQDKKSGGGCKSLAVVPWVPSLFSSTSGTSEVTGTAVSDAMEAEAADETMMDVEDSFDTESGDGIDCRGANVIDGLHHWQQQHCMFPQPPQEASTPIIWYR